MKYALAATAIATALTGAAYADTDMDMSTAELIRTRDITGGSIYTTAERDENWEENWENETYYNEVDPGWNDIGEIEDVVLNREGKLIGVVAEVGGFLDIADKHVMLPIEDMRLVPVDDRSYSVITRLSEEQLEEMEDLDEGWWN